MSAPLVDPFAIHQLLTTRRTVHDYEPAELGEGVLERALQAGLAAPNHRMTEPWRFVAVGPSAREELVEISIDLKAQKSGGELSESTRESVRRKMMDPAVLLVVCRVRHRDASVEREDYAAIACCVQNISLSLWAEGVGSKWSTGGVTTDARTYQLLGVDSVLQEIVGFVWIGAPGKECAKVQRKLGVSDVLRAVP